jgi:ribonuclease HI
MFEIYVDGSCDPNPGIGGWGLILVKENKIASEYVGGEKESTNNRMELLALINALELCSEHKAKTFKIFSDSQLAVKTYNEWMQKWGVEDEDCDRVNIDLVRRLFHLKPQSDHVTVEWIKAHNGNAFNEYADKLANTGRIMTTKGVVPAFGARLKIGHLVNGHLKRL